MRSIILTAIVANAAAAVIPQDGMPLVRRQLGGIPIPDVDALPTIKVASVEELTPKLAPYAIRQRIRWGPFDLTAVDPQQNHNVSIANEGDTFMQIIDGFCKDCMVLYGSSSLTYEDGTRADIGTGVYNHHIFIGAVGKKTKPFFICKNGTTSEPVGGHDHLKTMAGGVAVQVFGSGHDGSPVDYWDATGNILSGSYISATDTPIHFSTWVNYKEYKQQVYMTAEYEFVEGKPEGFVDSGANTVSVVGCERDDQFYPPENQTTTIYSPEYLVTAPGRVFNSMAHLHDGGVNVRLRVNNELVCVSEAIYGGGQGSTDIDGTIWETITGYTRCQNSILVKEGDIMTVDSTYDLKLHPLRPGAQDHSMSAEAMAIMAVIFAPDEELACS